MSQSIIVTLISIVLYLSGLFGGTSPSPDASPPKSVPPAASPDTSSAPSSGVITGNSVVVYQEIGSRDSVAELQRGDYVDILQREGSWYKVRLESGATGFVAAFALLPSDRESIPKPKSGDSQTTVLGYYLTDSRSPSLPSLQNNTNVLTSVAPWTWEVTAAGNLVASFNTKDTAAALKYAGERDLRTYALIHNFSIDGNGSHNFNANLASALLRSAQSRQRLVNNIRDTLTDWRMTGVHIDFEKVPPADRQNLVTFMRELYNTLHPAGFEVTMAVPSKTSDSFTNSWSGGYDYAALSRYVDQMMLMTYDEHWYGGPPGPIASIQWVEQVIRYSLNAGVPAHKVVLGIAGYGYDWPRNGTGRSVTYQKAMQIAEANNTRVQWDANAKSPYIRYGDGRQIWFENRQSISHKLALVNQYKLGGISLWRLGQEDPGVWPVIRDMLM